MGKRAVGLGSSPGFLNFRFQHAIPKNAFPTPFDREDNLITMVRSSDSRLSFPRMRESIGHHVKFEGLIRHEHGPPPAWGRRWDPLRLLAIGTTRYAACLLRSIERPSRRVRRASFSQRGSASLEYCIVLPVLLLFILGTIDMGRLIWASATLSRAVHAAARCGVVNALLCGTAGQIQADAVSETWALAVTASTFSVATGTCGLSVSASYTFTFFTPGMSNVTLNPAACFPQ
jgi:uncharacterized membrane protein